MSYYPHQLRDSVSPVHGIFFTLGVKNIEYLTYFVILKKKNYVFRKSAYFLTEKVKFSKLCFITFFTVQKGHQFYQMSKILKIEILCF